MIEKAARKMSLLAVVVALSTASTQYTSGPRSIATRPMSASIFACGKTRRIGIARSRSITSPRFQARFRTAKPRRIVGVTGRPLTLSAYRPAVESR